MLRLISLLLVLMLIGFLIKTQLSSPSSIDGQEEAVGDGGVTIPKVPSSPKDIKGFKDDMNKMMKDHAEKRARKLEESLAQ